MTDRIDFGGEPWQAIPRRILRDPQLSYRAKGGLVALLSHEEGWVRSAIATLMHEGNCGRKQAQAIMAELRKFGYAELVNEQIAPTPQGQPNLMKRRYVIYAIPKGAAFQPSLVNSSDRPVSVPSSSGSTSPRAVVVEALDVDPLDVDPKPLAPATRARDELFEALAEIDGTDLEDLTKTQRGRLNKATKELRDLGVSAEEVRHRAEQWTRRFPHATLTALALVAHWGELNSARQRKSTLTQQIELEEAFSG